ncbi:MAG: palindromic element RPE2 domain-containing protein [Rickettsia endosymbiont of Argas persicus]
MNALKNLILLEKDARDYGFDWSDYDMILEQVIDECREIKEAIENDETIVNSVKLEYKEQGAKPINNRRATSDIVSEFKSIDYKERVQEEIGDLLHTAISLCVFLGYDVEETLNKTGAKFTKRMKAVKTLTRKHNLPNLQGQSVEFMLQLWREAKEMTKEK